MDFRSHWNDDQGTFYEFILSILLKKVVAYLEFSAIVKFIVV